MQLKTPSILYEMNRKMRSLFAIGLSFLLVSYLRAHRLAQSINVFLTRIGKLRRQYIDYFRNATLEIQDLKMGMTIVAML